MKKLKTLLKFIKDIKVKNLYKLLNQIIIKLKK